MNKLVYLDPAILHINKIAMHEFWYDYVKPTYGEKTKLCNLSTYSFITQSKTEDIYVNIAKGVETIFDTSNYQLDH